MDNNDNAAIYGRYVNERVVNVNVRYGGRRGHDPQPLRQGTLVSVESGCNGSLIVRWDDWPWLASTAPQDLALLSTYPAHRWPHERE